MCRGWLKRKPRLDRQRALGDRIVTVMTRVVATGAMMVVLWLEISMLTGAAHAESMIPLRAIRPAAASTLGASALPADTILDLRIVFAPRDRDELSRLLRDQQDPSSSEYHRWLTAAEFAARFGPAPADVAAVSDWLAGGGFTVREAGPSYLRVSASAERAERAFAIRMVSSADGRVFSAASDPMIPARFAKVIAGIVGLDNLLHWKPSVDASRFKATPDANIGGVIGFAPADVYTFYDESPLLSGGIDGSGGRCIALIEDSDYLDSAVTSFVSEFHLAGANVTRVFPDGSNPGINGDEIESLLDIEWSHAIAPGAAITAYIGAGSNPLFDAIAQSVTDNTCGSINVSFSFCGAPPSFYSGSLDPLFQQAAAQGQSVFASSGDNGSAGVVLNKAATACVVGSTPNVSEMSADPEVTAVGGTQFKPKLNSASNDVGHVAERAWNEIVTQNGQQVHLGATGGGASAIFSKPAYQNGPGVANDGVRDVPDVAFGAGIVFPGFFMVLDSGGSPQLGCCVGGTSLSSAVWAGIGRLFAQQDAVGGGNGDLGSLNPRLYLLGQQLNSRATGFRDVTTGGNGFNLVPPFTAHIGFDQVTGWGTPDLAVFVPAFVSGSFQPLAPGPLHPAPGVLNFPVQMLSSVATQSAPKTSLVINRNPHNVAATIASVSISGDDFQMTHDGCTGTLSPGAKCQVSALFQPVANGLRKGALTLTGNFIGSPLTIRLAGKSVPPKLRIAPAALNFGKQANGTTSAEKTAALSNNNAVPITISSIASSTGDFAASQNCVGTIAQSGGTCTMSVTFTPSSTMLESATITLQDDAGTGSQIIHVSGRGF